MKRKRWRSADDASRFGFRWDTVDVIRETTHTTVRGTYLALAIETDRQIVRVWITPTGLIRLGTPFPQAGA